MNVSSKEQHNMLLLVAEGKTFGNEVSWKFLIFRF